MISNYVSIGPKYSIPGRSTKPQMLAFHGDRVDFDGHEIEIFELELILHRSSSLDNCRKLIKRGRTKTTSIVNSDLPVGKFELCEDVSCEDSLVYRFDRKID